MNKQIQIKSLELKNFKGIKGQSIDFDQDTSIFGENASGKTTIFDAFTWVLFGKDSKDRTDFNIKTINGDGKPIPKLEHSVEVVLLENDEEVKLKRVFKENWVKKRGSTEPTFSGNITDYYWDDVPVKKSEYDIKVADILDESVFKMITNPLAFTSLNWKKQRDTLTQIVGSKTNEEFAKGNKAYEELLKKVSEKKTLEQYESQIKASIKKAKEDIKSIPARIDEVEMSKPEALDFDSIRKDIKAKEKELKEIELQLQNESSYLDKNFEDQKDIRHQINDIDIAIESEKKRLEKMAKSIDEKAKQDLDNLENDKRKIKNALNANKQDFESNKGIIDQLENRIDDTDNQMEKLRKEYIKQSEAELTFDDSEFKCPTCKRAYKADDIEAKKAQMQNQFNQTVSKRLKKINEEGKSLKQEKAKLQERLSNLKKSNEQLQESIEDKEDDISNVDREINAVQASIEESNSDAEYQTLLNESEKIQQLKKDKEELTKQLEKLKNSTDTDNDVITNDLKNKKQELQSEINQAYKNLHLEEDIKRADKRIDELKNEEQKLSQQIADVEREQDLIEQFNKAKIQDLESRVNDLFELVDFRMFEEQINGGVKETCEAMVEGVPFSDVNNAMKINAGIDIINTLCDHYEVNAPIFIDNRESITDIIVTKSQTINLIVSAEHKKLKVA